MPDSKIITWFDIPAEDINRAVSFYNNVLGTSLQVIDFNGIDMAMFSENPKITSGAIVQSDFNNPSETGTTVYFWVDDLDGTLSKVEGAGGIILQRKTKINDEHGFYGLIKDTEGNRIGFHGIS